MSGIPKWIGACFMWCFFNYVSYTGSTEWTAVNGELEEVCREMAVGYLQLYSWNWYGGPEKNY